MTFAAFPLAWVLGFFGIASALVVAAYLLRRTPKRVVVSNVDFWLRAAQNAKPRVLASLRIPWLALLLSLLVAGLLVTLLGDPRFGRGVRGTTVIVLDAGRSMDAAGPSGVRRIDRASAEVRRWVERSTITGEVAIVRAGMRPSVVLPVTEVARDIDRALAALEVDHGPSDLAAAVAVADGIVAARSEAGTTQGQILVVTDQDLPRRVRARTEAPIVHLAVGERVDTVAISAFAARRVPEAVGEYTVRLEVTNHATRPARTRVLVSDGEVSVLDEWVPLAPREARVLHAGGFSSRLAALRATLESTTIEGSADGFAIDDEAVAVVAALDATRVLLVTEGDRYLEAALATHPGLDVEVLAPSGLQGMTSERLARYHVLLLQRVGLPSGLEHRAVVVMAPSDGVVGTRATPTVTGVLDAHPVLANVRLGEARLSQARSLRTMGGDTVLLRSGSDVLGLARTTRRGRLLVFGFDTTEIDLVQREGFPLLIHDALRWTADRGEVNPIATPVGGTLRMEAGETLHAADGTLLATPGGELPIVEHQGLYRAGERTLAFGSTRHAGAFPPRAAGGNFSLTSSLPPLAALVALALALLMLIEWALLHRGKLE